MVSWNVPTAEDNADEDPVVVCTPESGSAFTMGVTGVWCEAVDMYGNRAECGFIVDVIGEHLEQCNHKVRETASNPKLDNS